MRTFNKEHMVASSTDPPQDALFLVGAVPQEAEIAKDNQVVAASELLEFLLAEPLNVAVEVPGYIDHSCTAFMPLLLCKFAQLYSSIADLPLRVQYYTKTVKQAGAFMPRPAPSVFRRSISCRKCGRPRRQGRG